MPTCPTCLGDFPVKATKRIYCSRKCSNTSKSRIRRVTVVCAECSAPFVVNVARTQAKYCSRACKDKKRKVTVKLCVVCAEPFEVYTCTAYRFSTCTNSECRRANKTATRNPNWRGGVTKPRKRDMSLTEYKVWRCAVFLRDNYTCVMCGKRGGNLEADHIKPWAYFVDLRYDVSNGRTLCRACHKTTFKEVFKWRLYAST